MKMKLKDRINYKFQDLLGYAIINFVYFLCTIYGFERIKKLGYCLILKSERKDYDNFKKANIFRQEGSFGKKGVYKNKT